MSGTSTEGAAVSYPPRGLEVQPIAIVWQDAARMLGMRRTAFFELAARPGFPAPVFYGGKRRWIVAELERWILLQRPVPLTAAERGALERPEPAPRRAVRRRRA